MSSKPTNDKNTMKFALLDGDGRVTGLLSERSAAALIPTVDLAEIMRGTPLVVKSNHGEPVVLVRHLIGSIEKGSRS